MCGRLGTRRNSILLLCGLLTYLGLLQQVGTIASIQKALDHLGTGSPLILVVGYMTALLCNIVTAASLAVIVPGLLAIVPIAIAIAIG